MEGSMAFDSPRLDSNAGGGKYDSVNGRRLCKKILAKYVAYDPHTYILDGICPALDWFDLFPTTPTGLGKTGYLVLLMLVLRQIAANTALGLSKEVFAVDPIMVVACSTKALEDYILSIVRIEVEISLTRL